MAKSKQVTFQTAENRLTGKKLLKIFILSLTLLVWHRPSYSNVTTQDPYPQQWIFSVDTSYFHSTGNYDNEGYLVPLSGTNQYSLLQSEFGASYSFTKRWRLTGSVTAAYAKSLSDLFERTNNGLTEASALFEYWAIKGYFSDFILLSELTLPLYTLSPDGDEVLIDDGASTAELALQWNQHFPILTSEVYFGFLYRSEGLAGLLPWSVGISRQWKKWGVRWQIYGHETVLDDQYIQTPGVRTNLTNQVNGGSLYFYSINPSLLATKATISYLASGKHRISLGGGATIRGTRSGAGFFALVGYQLSFDAKKYRRKRKRGGPFVPEFSTAPEELEIFKKAQPSELDEDE